MKKATKLATFKGITNKVGKIIYLVKQSFNEFIDDNGMSLSASLSYYTIFSLPPLLIIIISLSGFFFGKDAVNGELFGQINNLVGNDVALQIQEVIKNISLSSSSAFPTVISIVFLLVGASTVFVEIQNSINYIWGIKAKPKKGLVKFLKNRLMSFSMIASLGFLMLVSLIVNSAMDILSSSISSNFSEDFVYLFYALNYILVFTIITLLFTLIFKTLPDGKVAFRDCLIGSSFTAVLFILGKFAIGFYLGKSTIESIYGAAGSVILIMIWIYYSAIILFFGAEFTKVYAITHGKNIIPKSYAIRITKPDPEE